MIKMVNLLSRTDGDSFEEFREYWFEEHAPLAKELPGLVRYATSVPTDPERAPYDGIVELYFEDMAALSAAFESEVGQRVQNDAAEFADVEAGPTMFVEETVQYEADAAGGTSADGSGDGTEATGDGDGTTGTAGNEG